MVTLADYTERLRRHDWTFDYSDDPRAFKAGAAEQSALLAIAKNQGEEFKRAYNTFFVLTFKKSSLPFPDAPPLEPTEQPKTKTQNTPAMKVEKLMKMTVAEALPLLLAGLVALGTGSAPASTGEEKEPEEKSSKKDKKSKKDTDDDDDEDEGKSSKKDKKSKKDADDDDDDGKSSKKDKKSKKDADDDDDDEDEGPTMEELREQVKLATEKGKKSDIVEELEEYGVEKVTELKKKHWPAFLKFVKKLNK